MPRHHPHNYFLSSCFLCERLVVDHVTCVMREKNVSPLQFQLGHKNHLIPGPKLSTNQSCFKIAVCLSSKYIFKMSNCAKSYIVIVFTSIHLSNVDFQMQWWHKIQKASFFFSCQCVPVNVFAICLCFCCGDDLDFPVCICFIAVNL